jgi:hypothetical protein
MDGRNSVPRGLTSRSLLAVGIFAVAVVPGWVLGDLAGQWTGWALVDTVVTLAGTAVSVRLLAPHASYRARDGWLGLVPLYGWYLVCVLAWRVALLPLRDWEPRSDELWRARWLTGELLGYWRADRQPSAGSRSMDRAKPLAGSRTEAP